ncbi:cache domain-containing sensor histidine kinase [Gracilibacillus salinarum]|uniref:histidine kinase n=1 Tax=Gracilibacillus salinarum TaxID=2932255 RepID=A0ABY4GS22_9BACI|nr:sensor histidine kinase [Gracilibacillus salinarum]UOQ86940.1 sensor histidine kinase [Gracilibacillus salinarum]
MKFPIRIQSFTFKTKMFLAFASAFIIVIIIIGTAIFLFNVDNMKKNTHSLSNILSTQFSKTIDLYFEDIDRVSLAIFTDPYVQDMLEHYDTEEVTNDIDNRKDLYPKIFNQIYPNEDIEGVTIYTTDKTAFTYQEGSGMELQYREADPQWMAQLDGLKKDAFLLLPTRQVTISKEEKQVVSFVRHIYGIPRRNKIGSLKIDINVNVFDKLLELDKLEELEEYLHVFVLTDENQVIYDQEREAIGDTLHINLPNATNDLAQNWTLTWNDRSYLSASNSSAFTGWQSLLLVDNHFIISERNQILLFMVGSGLITILIIAIISYSLSYSLSKPLILLRKKMERVESGDLADRMDLTNNEELNVLIRVYNSMLDSINKLITEVYQSSIAEKNAKISALQSQINPHFLYNTLNVMKSSSRVKGVEEVAVLAESLADLFKYTAVGLNRKVMVAEEIEHIHNYMRIQQYRFVGRFDKEISVSEEAKHARIPKLLVQPIVENAVIHGLKHTKKNGIIRVRIDKEAEFLHIEVTDNGQGMDAETLTTLSERIRNNKVDSDETSVGLINVAQRIRLLYGYRYRLEMESEKDRGTRMVMKIPFEEGSSYT